MRGNGRLRCLPDSEDVTQRLLSPIIQGHNLHLVAHLCFTLPYDHDFLAFPPWLYLCWQRRPGRKHIVHLPAQHMGDGQADYLCCGGVHVGNASLIIDNNDPIAQPFQYQVARNGHNINQPVADNAPRQRQHCDGKGKRGRVQARYGAEIAQSSACPTCA